MPKKKSVLQPIANPSIRRAIFKKRKASLIKKALELSTLCHVDVCTVISQGPHDPHPETWPAGEDTMQILSRFGALPDAEKSKRMVNSERFLLQQMEKIQAQLRKLQSENCDLETKILLHDVLQGQTRIADVASTEMIVNLGAVVEMRLKEVGKRISDLPPPPVLPPLVGVDTWPPSVPDHLMGFTANVISGQGQSTEMENDWQGVTISNLAPPPVLPTLMGVDTWSPSVALPDPFMGFNTNVVSGQCWSTEMENDWQGMSGGVPGPTGVDVAPAVAGPHVEEEIEGINFSSFEFDDEMTSLLFC
ncbi:AGAMOUS-like MADS-box protein [Rhynchospora pubera]|uniref:AGAMOUS-like MADS-box protein n=1 Tax=Rhynchospora pubera TaxID=906938 RepID=A0AAV8CLF4_9POAL|nr:AGAMOUS-like MADS-box protein [Rhynchospora pubera]